MTLAFNIMIILNHYDIFRELSELTTHFKIQATTYTETSDKWDVKNILRASSSVQPN